MGKTARPTARTAAPVVEESAEVPDFPMAMYKKNDKKSDGYDVERAEDASAGARLLKRGFKPADEFFGNSKPAESQPPSDE